MSTVHEAKRWALPRPPFRFHRVFRLWVFLAFLVWIADAIPVQAQGRSDDPCANPQNPVVAENCLPGTEDWKVTNPSEDIEGYAWPSSVVPGEKVNLFVNTSAPRFTISFYRSGYYGGLGGRLMQTVEDVGGCVQPGCNHDVHTGLTSCATWSPSYSLTIPENWVSGVYIAKLTRPDTGGESYILLTVRDDERKSEILFQQSYFTYHAYNNYGGKSSYQFNSTGCPTVTETKRAAKVSFRRPYGDGHMTIGGNAGNSYFRVEYPMVRWLEQQGYDVTYSTNLDTHRSGKPGAQNKLLNHRVFLSVGHDEYWSQEMRDAVTAARDAGVHIGVFSSNTMYWRVRLEADPWSNEPESVMVVYKTTESGPADPSGHPTGTWRDPEGANDPENGLVGVQYIGDNDHLFFPLRVTSDKTSDRIYRHTGLQKMPPHTYINIGHEIFGWEWDAVVDNGHTPEGLQILAETPVMGMLLQDAGNSENGMVQRAFAHTTRYTAPSGAIVFASATNQWSWGLGSRSIEAIPVDPYIQQITYNILADMGVQPGSPDESLILDGETRELSASPEAFRPLEAPDNPPVVTNIQVSNPTSAVAIITWETDRPTVGQVWIGTKPEHLHTSVASDAEMYESAHSAYALLYSGTTFYFTVVAVDKDWRITFSDIGTFTTGRAPYPRQIGEALGVVQCWIQANPIQTAGIGVAGGAAVLFAVLGVAALIRRRRGSRSSAARPSTSAESG